MKTRMQQARDWYHKLFNREVNTLPFGCSGFVARTYDFCGLDTVYQYIDRAGGQQSSRADPDLLNHAQIWIWTWTAIINGGRPLWNYHCVYFDPSLEYNWAVSGLDPLHLISSPEQERTPEEEVYPDGTTVRRTVTESIFKLTTAI